MTLSREVTMRSSTPNAMTAAALALAGALTSLPNAALACGGMMMVDAPGGMPVVDVLGTRIRAGEGALTSSEVNQVAYQNLYSVESCYEEMLTRLPDGASGLVMATVTIDAAGRASKVIVRSKLPRDVVFESCVGSMMQAWVYAKPKGGQAVTASTVFRMESDVMSAEPQGENGLAQAFGDGAVAASKEAKAQPKGKS
jgi:hypothetical protein